MEEINLQDGDGLKILDESKEFRFKCCGCGFVHRVEIDHEEDGTVLRFYEENS